MFITLRLLDFVEPHAFADWANVALDHLQENNVTRIMQAAQDEGLQHMARALVDGSIQEDQAMAVLVALDLYLQDTKLKKGGVLPFAPKTRK